MKLANNQCSYSDIPYVEIMDDKNKWISPDIPTPAETLVGNQSMALPISSLNSAAILSNAQDFSDISSDISDFGISIKVRGKFTFKSDDPADST